MKNKTLLLVVLGLLTWQQSYGFGLLTLGVGLIGGYLIGDAVHKPHEHKSCDKEIYHYNKDGSIMSTECIRYKD